MKLNSSDSFRWIIDRIKEAGEDDDYSTTFLTDERSDHYDRIEIHDDPDGDIARALVWFLNHGGVEAHQQMMKEQKEVATDHPSPLVDWDYGVRT